MRATAPLPVVKVSPHEVYTLVHRAVAKGSIFSEIICWNNTHTDTHKIYYQTVLVDTTTIFNGQDRVKE